MQLQKLLLQFTEFLNLNQQADLRCSPSILPISVRDEEMRIYNLISVFGRAYEWKSEERT